MKKFFNISCMLIIFIFIGCRSVKDETYVPSIVSLKPNEILVMKYRSCHNGCVKGTVKFKNGEAIIGQHSLKLTTKEIADLDNYFLLGENERWMGSIIIHISFKHKEGLRTLNYKDTQVFPWGLFEGVLIPEQLVCHLNVAPNKVPSWRLSPEELSQRHALTDSVKNYLCY